MKTALKKKARCQRVRLADAWVKLESCLDLDTLRDVVQTFDEVLAEAQNQPPLGAADGSIDEESWLRFNRISKATHEFIEALTGRSGCRALNTRAENNKEES